MAEISKWWLQRAANAKTYVVRIELSDGTVLQRSTKERLKKKAQLKVSDVLKEVQARLEQPVSNWSRFVSDYEADHSDWSKKQVQKWKQVRHYFEMNFKPVELSEITQPKINDFCRRMANESESKLTARNKISVLRAALNYAKRQGLIENVPVFTMPKIIESDETTGRPLTKDEVQHLLSVVPSVVGNDSEASWKFYINGLLNSGFRLKESTLITWNDRRFISIDDIDSDVPMFLFPQGSDKNKKKKRVPIIPAMRDQLLAVPRMERTGYLFNPTGPSGKRLSYRTIMKYFKDLGEQSGIVTDFKSDGSSKYVSAHDLRRTFAERVVDDPNISPKDSQVLMRHASFSTTMKHYARRAPEELGKRIYSNQDDLTKLLKEVAAISDMELRAKLFNQFNEAFTELTQPVESKS